MDNFGNLFYRQSDKKLDYAEDVKNCPKREELNILTNRGSLLFDWKWHLTFLSLNVQVNKNSLATIPSLKDVNNIPVVRVTMDTSIEKTMNMIMKDGIVFKFN